MISRTDSDQDGEDDTKECIEATFSGAIKTIALIGLFAVAIIYDGQFLYVAMGAGLIILGISVKQVLDYKTGYKNRGGK